MDPALLARAQPDEVQAERGHLELATEPLEALLAFEAERREADAGAQRRLVARARRIVVLAHRRAHAADVGLWAFGHQRGSTSRPRHIRSLW
jgi:hypothetical protein